nr:hypothetical protein [Tanacetum cinerariifolium]
MSKPYTIIGHNLKKYNPKIVRISFNSQLEAAKKVGLKAKAKTHIGKTNQDVLIKMEKYKKGITISNSKIESIHGNCLVERRSPSEHELSELCSEVIGREKIMLNCVGTRGRVLPALSVEATRFVFVGDPKQLPAIVTSQTAKSLHFECSLFKNNDLIKNRRGDLPHLTPFLFYNVDGVEQKTGSSSWSFYNERECVLCYLLYKELQDMMKLHGGKVEIRVGIITPYTNQVGLYKKTIRGKPE